MGRRWFRRSALGALAMAAAMAGAGLPGSEVAAQQAPATVRVVHGLRGLVADVYLDGVLALPTFQPERSTDPLTIPAGPHLIEVRTAGSSMSATPALTRTIDVPAGFVGSVIAHLDPDGAPTLSVFADDLSPIAAGQTRLVVRHAAAAPPIDVLINDLPSITALAPTKQSAPTIAPGEHRIMFRASEGAAAVGTPQRVALAEGKAQFVYLIGSAAEGTLGWAAVQVGGLDTAPTRIQTGDGSTRNAGGSGGLAVAPVVLALAAVVVAGGVGTVRTARRAA